MESIINRSGVEIAARIGCGEISCEDVAREALARIAAREPAVRAWAFLDAEYVIAQARALDASPSRGPLHGVPLGIKDVIETAEMPTQMGSPIYGGYRPKADAACVALARAAGALILGKTVTAEFAGMTPGVTANPLDRSRTPGGSSSGSAAAVADFMVPIALGTQTGGSVHRPASFCGVIGFKPTRALLNKAGVKPAAEFLDTLGIIARHLDDVQLLFSVLTNGAPEAVRPAKPRRLGLCRTPLWSRAQPETVHAIEDAARRASEEGVDVVEIVLPPLFDELDRAREYVNAYQRAHAMAYEWSCHRGRISEGLAKTIRQGFAIAPEQISWALGRIDAARAALPGIFAGVDLLLAPCVNGEAPVGLDSTGDPAFQAFWTMLDVPTMSLPTSRGPNGLPVSIQLVAAPLAEGSLLATSAWALAALGAGEPVRSR